MKVLIVGAGAVGQVYGYHLQKGGADVTFYVRPKYVEGLRGGMILYSQNRGRGLREPVKMSGYGLVSTDEEVRATRWDYVFLCTHADAVHTPWFGPFAAALGTATVVSLLPGLEARTEILKHVPASRLIEGMITLISYLAPLPGESVAQPGVAFWIPPLTRLPFQGPPAWVEPLLEVFKRGGFPARQVSMQADPSGGIVADTILKVFVLALEGAGWRFDSFLKPEQVALNRAATLETLEVQFRLLGLKRPSTGLLRAVLSGAGLRAILILSRWIIPFDIETYLRVHFTKIRAQGRLGLASTLRHALELGIPVPALRRLAVAIPSALDGSAAPR